MTEHPILFSGPMIRAILEGRKGQTRRILSPHNSLVDGGPWPKGWTFDFSAAWVDKGPSPAGNPGPYLHAPRVGADTTHRIYPRYWPGSTLWVRETWAMGGNGPFYKATDTDGTVRIAWHPSIHMPRRASRLTLRITEVRVQRLQEITDGDADREGIPRNWCGNDFTNWNAYDHGYLGPGEFGSEDATDGYYLTARDAFSQWWDAINKRAPWASNPYVWAISFERVPPCS